MNDNENDSAYMARAIMVAIDEATRARPMEPVKVVASLGVATASIYLHHMMQGGTATDVMCEVLLGTSFREGLAALRTATPPPEPVQLHSRKRGRNGGKR